MRGKGAEIGAKGLQALYEQGMEMKNSPNCGSPLCAPAGIIYEPVFYFVFYPMKHLPLPATLQNHFPSHCPCSAECTGL